ncbi:MAG: glutaredoxin 3 [Betaproteobacteria bacterium]|nr:MAG: glutaredoxin 3 [Betaproteobacteria bacterium]
MPVPIRMYSTAVCPFCIRAERLLLARGVGSIEKLRVDLDPALREEMIRQTGRRTVPQIFIDGLHVGGFEELAELDREGKLMGLLQP